MTKGLRTTTSTKKSGMKKDLGRAKRSRNNLCFKQGKWSFKMKQSTLNRFQPREGAIIECPLSGLFHDLVTAIITSRIGVSEMVVNIGNVVTVI